MPIQIENCRHYWDIEPPSGQCSEGTCRNCGDQKTFRNYYGEQVKSYPSSAPEHIHKRAVDNTNLITEEYDLPDTESTEAQWPVVQAYLRKRLIEATSTRG